MRLLSVDEPMVSDGTGVVVDRDQLERAYRRLSMNHRTVVVLHHYLDLPLDPELPEAAAAPVDGVAVTAAPAYDMVEGVPSSLEAYLDAKEREAVLAALARTRQNRTAAAQLLGITFRQLRYRMQRLGLK